MDSLAVSESAFKVPFGDVSFLKKHAGNQVCVYSMRQPWFQVFVPSHITISLLLLHVMKDFVD